MFSRLFSSPYLLLLIAFIAAFVGAALLSIAYRQNSNATGIDAARIHRMRA